MHPKIRGVRLYRMFRARSWTDMRLDSRRTRILMLEIRRQQKAGRTDDAIELALDVIRSCRTGMA